MLPEEILEQLSSSYPCRSHQARQLAALYASTLPSPPLLVAHGLTATGKSSLIKSFLALSQKSHAIISSRECITGRHLLERTVSKCLDALDEHDGERLDKRPYMRTDSLNSLMVHLQRILEGRRSFVLVFDGIDKQREAPPTLLPALARFGEMIPNLSIIMIATLPLSHALHKAGVPHLHFPSYIRTELFSILNMSPPKIFLEPPDEEQFEDYTPDLAAEDDAWLWNRFLTAVWDSLSKHTGRDLISFRNTATRLWRPFVAPIVDGTFGTRDFSRLMVNRRHLFQLEDAVLDHIISQPAMQSDPAGTTPSTPSAKALVKRKTIQHDLPYYTTYLLISAYLASYNPARTDTTYFMTHTDKRKNRRRSHAQTGTSTALSSTSKHKRIPRHLLTPSPFPLDRLFAIFRSLVDGPVPQVADLYTQVATLASMRLLVRAGAAGADGEGCRWRVAFGWEWVRSLGRSVGVEVGEFLVGGVDG